MVSHAVACRSKINRPHIGKIENLFFYLARLFFHVEPNMFIFEFHFCINHYNCHDTSMQRFFRKVGIFIFLPICLIDFDHQDGWPMFQREVTVSLEWELSIAGGIFHLLCPPPFSMGGIYHHTCPCILYEGFFLSRNGPGPEVIKLFSCWTQMSMNFQLLIKTKIHSN